MRSEIEVVLRSRGREVLRRKVRKEDLETALVELLAELRERSTFELIAHGHVELEIIRSDEGAATTSAVTQLPPLEPPVELDAWRERYVRESGEPVPFDLDKAVRRSYGPLPHEVCRGECGNTHLINGICHLTHLRRPS